jgi:multiple sugar transport system ATP-binding protein
MATLALRDLAKTYGGDVEAVRAMSLAVDEGKLLALLGPSGCGKTSTCKMIAGLESITSGDLLFDSERVNELEPERRNVAMVFEDYALYPRMTVFDNVAFPLRVRGVPRAEIREQVMQMLEKLELTPVAGSRVTELSGGQQQRISIARALVRQPAVLILDEPLSHLDADLKARLRAEIRWLQQERGVTGVIVTHDQAEAMAMADEIAVMHEGVLHQCATPHDIYDRPADMFVAGFIGEPPMNFVPGRLVRGEGGPHFTADGVDLALAADALQDAVPAEGREVVMGLRPEYGELVAPGAGQLTAEVFFSEWFGTHQVVMLSRPGRGDRWLTVITEFDREIHAGDPATVAIDTARLSFFDPETERNLIPAEGGR